MLYYKVCLQGSYLDASCCWERCGLLTEGGEEVGDVRVAPCAHAPGVDMVLGCNLGGSESGLSGRGVKGG